MASVVAALQLLLAGALVLGSLCWLITALCALIFRRQSATRPRNTEFLPPLSLLKPVCGLEKNLAENLRTACTQDYPDYQIVLSVQRPDDPALPVLYDIQREFGEARVSVAVESVQVGLNGKINNLAGALKHAEHDLLVISDSDVSLRPDYLRTIVAPLADPSVGGVSTLFRAIDAERWYEHMELLTLNADQVAVAIAARMARVVDFCFGASMALTRQTLEQIGGVEALGGYLVEDNEMGQRIVRSGKRLLVLPYLIDMTVDLGSPRSWWAKQTYWDQNTRAAIPGIFASTLVLRTVPFALLFAALRGFDARGLAVVAAVLAARLGSAAVVLAVGLRDRKGLASLWLLPIKDTLSLFWFTRAFLKRTVIWRGVEMGLTRDGRLIPLSAEHEP